MVLAFVGAPVEPITEALDRLGSTTRRRIVERGLPAIITSVLGTAVPQLRPLIVVGSLASAGYAYYRWTQEQAEAVQRVSLGRLRAARGGNNPVAYQVVAKAKFVFDGNAMSPRQEIIITCQGVVQGPLQGIPSGDFSGHIGFTFGGFGGIPGVVVRNGSGNLIGLSGFTMNPPLRGNSNNFTVNILESATITSIERADGEPDYVDDGNWEALSPTQRQSALNNLPLDIWDDIISSTPVGGRLQPGQVLNSPAIFTGDPTSTDLTERDPRVIDFSDAEPWSVPLSIPISTGDNPSDVAGSPYELPVIPASTSNTNISVDPTTGAVTRSPAGTPDPVTGQPTTPAGQNVRVPIGPNASVTFTPDGQTIPEGQRPTTPLAPPPPDLQLPDIWNELQKIKNALPLIAPAAGMIMAPALVKILDKDQTKEVAKQATKEGICQEALPDACLGRPFGEMGTALSGIGGGIRGIEAGQLAAAAAAAGAAAAALACCEATKLKIDQLKAQLEEVEQTLKIDWDTINIPTLSNTVDSDTGLPSVENKSIQIFKTRTGSQSLQIRTLFEEIRKIVNNTNSNSIEEAVDRGNKKDYPMIVPEYLLASSVNTPLTIASQIEFNAWLIKNIDALVGQFPVKIEREVSEGRTETLTYENIAEGMAEVTGLLAKIAFDADTAVNVGTRAIAEALGARISAQQAGSYLKAIIDYLGFHTQAKAFDMKISCTPGATGADNLLQESELEDFLKPSTQIVVGLECSEKDDLHTIIKRILFDAEIARAALYKPLKRNEAGTSLSLTGDSIKDNTRKETAKTNAKWEEFKRRVEADTTLPFRVDIDESSGSPTEGR